MPMNNRLMRPRAKGGFDPKTISGLEVWYDANASSSLYDATSGGSAVAADGSVGRWEDLSGNARHATQGIANNRPLRKLGVANGKDAVRFNGTSHVLSAAMSLAQPINYFLVAMNAGANAASNDQFLLDGSSGRIWTGRLSGASTTWFSGAGASLFDANGWPDGTLRAMTFIANGASSILRRNGSQVTSGNAGSLNLSTDLRIGAYSPGSGFYWNGDLSELLIYSGSLSATSISKIEGYLIKKYGTT